MKLSRLLHYAACSLAVSLLLISARPVVAQGTQVIPFQDASLHGLTLTLRLDREALRASAVPTFRVELRNTTRQDMLLNLGTMTRDGVQQYPTAVSLVLITAEGKTQRLVPRTFAHSQNKPLVLPLLAGATFSFPVNLANYWIMGSKGVISKLQAGNYSLRAQFTGSADLRDVRSWDQRPRNMPISEAPFDQVQSQPSGTPMSNELQFEIAR